MKDLIVAARALYRTPVFTSIAILSLALAIGPNAAIFAVIDAVLFRPLPAITQPDRLVSIYHNNTQDPKTFNALSWLDFNYYQSSARSFSGMLAYLRLPLSVRLAERRENLSAELVSDNYLQVLGVAPRLGRDFNAADREPAVLISEQLWRDRFQSDPNLLGRTMQVGASSFAIIGVLPAAFRGIVMDWGERPQVWIPMRFYREAVPALAQVEILREWGMRSMVVTARLGDQVSLDQAQAEVEALARRINLDHPERDRNPQKTWIATAMPLGQARFWPGARANVVTVLLVLILVAASVLVIACANVAMLLLTRAAHREREISVRIALGAKPRAVLKLLLAESLILALGGCGLGLLLGVALTKGLSSFPKILSVPLTLDLSVDWRSLSFCAAIGILICIGVSLAPVRHFLRTDLTTALNLRGATSRLGWRRWNTRYVLSAAQIAISLVLLVQAGLFLRTFQSAAESDSFLRAGNLFLAKLQLPQSENSLEVQAKIARELPSRMQQFPAVQRVVFANVLPSSGVRSATEVQILAPSTQQEPIRNSMDSNEISPGFFDLTGSSLLRGRDFTALDLQGQSKVAIVNQELADQYWGGDAIGKRVQVRGQDIAIVGLVKDQVRRSYRDAVPPRIYFPITPGTRASLSVIVLARDNSLQALPSLQQALAQLAPDAVLDAPQTLAAYASVVLAQERLAAWCLGALASIALILSLIGLYGTVAYSVAQRRGEIGIRLALGSSSFEVVQAMLRPVAAVSLVGFVAGSILCVAAMRLSESLLYGITGADPSTWILAGGLLASTALAAAALPAVLASRSDPSEVLRSS
ncbi:ADOP family duplicated permease [Bryobacter aggregatus]|uniref:ADOP family duplicated permease n=1 Tax=Bryobacter aggregatus TaxID=360054 RepID=UPI0004E0FDA5|nr:ADOP family duplicated permease [Bryobacter aggregatus]